MMHTIEIEGLKRDLPLCAIGGGLRIAAFVMFGDVELTVACAEALLKKAPAFDVLVTAEAKGIPLVYEMARTSGKHYVVARKTRKLYMPDSLSVDLQSITTEGRQTLFIDTKDAGFMQGKRVLLVDDVVSTGESLRALEKLVAHAGGGVVGRMAVLAEGAAHDNKDLTYLEYIPLFDNNGNPV